MKGNDETKENSQFENSEDLREVGEGEISPEK